MDWVKEWDWMGVELKSGIGWGLDGLGLDGDWVEGWCWMGIGLRGGIGWIELGWAWLELGWIGLSRQN